MDITVVNAVVCNRAEGHERYTLHGVGSKWPEPPSQLAVWIELRNPAERAFSVGVSLWRGQKFIDESPGELVLKGHPYWQSLFEFHGADQLEAKTHSLHVLLDGLDSRIINIDLGAPDAP